MANRQGGYKYKDLGVSKRYSILEETGAEPYEECCFPPYSPPYCEKKCEYICCKRGPPGPPGEKGEQGEKGEKGDKGEPGNCASCNEQLNVIFDTGYDSTIDFATTVITSSGTVSTTTITPTTVPFIVVGPPSTILPSSLTGIVSIFFFPGRKVLGRSEKRQRHDERKDDKKKPDHRKRLFLKAKAVVGAISMTTTTLTIALPAVAPIVTATALVPVFTLNTGIGATSGTSVTVSLINFITGVTIASGTAALSGLTLSQPQVLELIFNQCALPQCASLLAVRVTTTGGTATDSSYIASFTLFTTCEERRHKRCGCGPNSLLIAGGGLGTESGGGDDDDDDDYDE
jgi:hypothetical protein